MGGGSLGFKALEVGGDVDCREMEMVDSEDLRQTFSPLRSLCQSARTAGISEEEAPTLGSIPISLCTFPPPRAGLA